MRKSILLALALASTLVLAKSEYAWQWPIETNGASGALSVDLSEEVYAHITRQDLADVAALNSAGENIPIGMYVPPSQPPQPATKVSVPYFSLPRNAEANASPDLSLQIERDANGQLRRIDLRSDGGGEAAVSEGGDTGAWLLDLSQHRQPLRTLHLRLDPAQVGDVNLMVWVDYSDDLAQWNNLGQAFAVVRLTQNGMVLEDARIHMNGSSPRYVRIRAEDDSTLPALTAIEAEGEPKSGPAAPLLQVMLAPSGNEETPGQYVFRSPGPLPVREVMVHLSQENTVAQVRVESRADANSPWQQQGQFTGFNMQAADRWLNHDPLTISPSRDREWRVSTTPAQLVPPQLSLGYHPDRFVVLTQGEGPYRLVAGSVNARRDEAPVQTMLSEMRVALGNSWSPPSANLGEGSVLAGEAALRVAPKELDLKQIGLWVVLVGGALLVMFAAWRVLKTPTATT